MSLDAVASGYAVLVQQQAVASHLGQVEHLLGLALDEQLAQLVASDWKLVEMDE